MKMVKKIKLFSHALDYSYVHVHVQTLPFTVPVPVPVPEVCASGGVRNQLQYKEPSRESPNLRGSFKEQEV